MKIILSVISLFIFFQGYSQKAWLEKSEDQNRIYFSVSREANIRYYVVEGANDSVNFQIINTLASKGNTVLPRTYVFDNTGEKFKNYRIKQIDLSGICLSCMYIYTAQVNYPMDEKQLQQLSRR